MNILILGGNGYIGSKITRKLVNAGHTIVCTKRTNSDLSRVGDIKDKVKWIPASIDGVEAAMQYAKFDQIINVACNYGRSTVLYGDVINSNIEFPLKVLNSAVERGTKRFLTIGTGLPDELNMYSFSKKMFAEFGRFYVEKHGITFNSLLLEMFYGADEPKDRFLPSVIRKMLDGTQVDVTLGSQHRDIINAEDIVDAIQIVLDSNLAGYNEIPVGTGIAPTVSEIVDYIWDKTGRRSIINKGAIPMRDNEPDCVADISMLRSMCSWNPKPWKEGISEMIDLMKMEDES